MGGVFYFGGEWGGLGATKAVLQVISELDIPDDRLGFDQAQFVLSGTNAGRPACTSVFGRSAVRQRKQRVDGRQIPAHCSSAADLHFIFIIPFVYA
jgi:hypothetical protein